MNVSGIRSHGNWAFDVSPSNGLHKGHGRAAAQGQTEQASAAAEGTHAKGVLRLLQAGHFKGVADLRLRINFHEELSAMQDAADQKAASGAISDLSSAVGSAIQSLSDGQTLTEEQQQAIGALQETFAQAVTDAGTAYAAGKDGAKLQADLQGAFEALLGGLQTLLAPAEPAPTDMPADPPIDAEPPPPVEDASAQPPADVPVIEEPAQDITTVPVGDTTDESTDVSADLSTEVLAGADALADVPVETAASPLDALRDVFAAALEQVKASLTSVQLLPELSPPTGNGRAYDKFLAIYNSLQAPAAPAPEMLDAQA